MDVRPETDLAEEEVALCSASYYTKKFYLNPEFDNLPELVKKELKVMSVLFTEEVSGVILFYFDAEGSLIIITQADEADVLYDEIGAHLLIKRMQTEHEELFLQLEQYYAAFFLNRES